ncbi:MAG: GNAT family N-acetyltransferase [Streptosporangiales bacterium]|nr:GNAT family N-acetyltransferase [Streptosporangiales bacterium]
MDVEITKVPEAGRYEAHIGEELAGFAEYTQTDRLVVFTHTEVEGAFEGKGVGSALARRSLNDVRGQGLHVLPLCPFYKAYIGRHPEYQDLLYHAPESEVRD